MKLGACLFEYRCEACNPSMSAWGPFNSMQIGLYLWGQ